MSQSYSDRIKGMILSGLTGEMIGAPYEGMKRQNIPDNFIGKIATKGLTDDGMMTIQVIEVLNSIASPTVDDFHKAYCTDLNERLYPKDLYATLSSLAKYYKGELKEPPTPVSTYTNTSVMRVSPFATLPDNDATKKLIERSMYYTHNNDIAKINVFGYVGVLRSLLNREPIPEGAIVIRAKEIGKSTVDIHRAFFGRTNHLAIRVTDCITVALAIYFRYIEQPTQGFKECIKLGGVTGTTTKLLGELYGATYGIDILNQGNISKLDEYERIVEAVNGLI